MDRTTRMGFRTRSDRCVASGSDGLPCTVLPFKKGVYATNPGKPKELKLLQRTFVYHDLGIPLMTEFEPPKTFVPIIIPYGKAEV